MRPLRYHGSVGWWKKRTNMLLPTKLLLVTLFYTLEVNCLIVIFWYIDRKGTRSFNWPVFIKLILGTNLFSNTNIHGPYRAEVGAHVLLYRDSSAFNPDKSLPLSIHLSYFLRTCPITTALVVYSKCNVCTVNMENHKQQYQCYNSHISLPV